MRIVILAVTLAASSAWAQQCEKVVDCPGKFMGSPVAPSASDRILLQQKFAAIPSAQADEDRARAAMAVASDGLKGRVRDSLNKSYPLLPGFVIERMITAQKLKEAESADHVFVDAQEKLRTAVNASFRARNEAIIATMKAYQLTPVVSDFRGDPRAASPNMIAVPWNPHYSRREKFENGKWRPRSRNEITQEAAMNTQYGGGAMLARTRGNGIMEFYDNAFDNPDTLALAIFHETSHWIDVAAKSGGHNRSDLAAVTFRTEQRAYEQAEAMASLIGSDPAPHRSLAAQFRMQAEIAERYNMTRAAALLQKNWIGMDWAGSLSVAPPESELEPGDEALLSQKISEAQDYVKRQRQERARLAEEARRPELQPIPLHPGTGWNSNEPIELHPERPPLPIGPIELHPESPATYTLIPALISTIARNACGQADFEGQLARIPWADFHRLDDFSSLENGRSMCEIRVFRRLVDFGRNWNQGMTITPFEVKAAMAEPYNPPTGGVGRRPEQSHDPVWGRVPIIRHP